MIPFLTMVFATLQMGIYWMAQGALQAGVLQTANQMQSDMAQAGASYSAPSATTVKNNIVSNGDVMLNGAALVADMQQLPNLSSAVTPIADGTIDVGSSGSILVLRARVPVFGFVGGMMALTVNSSAVVRRATY